LRSKWKSDRVWKPNMGQGSRDRFYRGWKKAVTRSFGWTQD
jgi:glycerol kinase